MIAPILQLYPFFKGGLPLKSDDLNQLVKYLESEDRNTRTCLIGMGNLHGLHIVKNSDLSVTISAGAGVTSLGYLMCLDKMDFNSLVETEVFDNDFQFSTADVLFQKPKTGQLGSTNDKVYELVKTTGNNTLKISDLENKVIVLLYQINGIFKEGCNLCDRVVTANAQIRVLLMSEVNYKKMEGNCPVVVNPNSFTTAFPRLNRLGFTQSTKRIDWSNFNNSASLWADYQQACVAATATLVLILKQLHTDFKNIFKTSQGSPAPDWDFSFLDTIKPFDPQKPKDINSLFSQYVHDYLRHLIRAYEEFVSTPMATTVRGLADKSCFPRHLALGKFTSEMGIIETADFRTPLYRPRFDDLTETDFQYSQFLFNRIGILLANVDFENLNISPNTEGGEVNLRITPSALRSAALGQQAIPYFLKSDVVKNTWQYNLTKTGRTAVIPTYNDAASDSLFYQNVFDNADFYRIEGHIGRNLNLVWKIISRKRLDLNLPFSVEIIELTEATRATFTTLLEFIKKNIGLEHQGGVPRGGTFVLVVESNGIAAQETFMMRDLTDKQVDALGFYTVVADFCLPYRVPEKPRILPVAYFTIENADKITAGQAVRFINQSPKPQAFEWFVDQQPVPVNEVDNVLDLRHTFNFDDDVATERTFVVTLVAKSIEDPKLPPDVASQGISIKRTVAKVDNPTALFKETSRGELQGKGVPVTFDNASLHADTYEWFIDGVSVQLDSFKVPYSHTFSFDDDVATERTFVVTLVARTSNPKATSMSDSTSQGVVIKRTIIKLEKPVANFEIGLRQRIPENTKTLKTGENITFNNKSSSSALSFRWFVDNNEVSKQRDLIGQPFTFKDDSMSEQDFVLTLIAYNKVNQMGDEDVEKLTITIRREFPAITTDFNFIPNLGLTFDKNNKAALEVGENVVQASFQNLSKNGSKYQWKVFLEDNITEMTGSLMITNQVEEVYPKNPFNFRVINGKSTTYLIQLIAFDERDKPVLPGVIKFLTVSFPKVITADFEFETPTNIRFGEKNEIETNKLDVDASFVNLSENGNRYEWRVFDVTSDKILLENSLVKTSQKSDLYKFKFSVGNEALIRPKSFLIQLIVFDLAGNQAIKREKRFGLRPILGIANFELLQENIAPTDVVESVDEPVSRSIDIPTIDGLTASRNLEARRRDFHQKIEDEGTANAPLSKLATYKNVLTFMTDFDKAIEEFDLVGALEKTFDKLDDFDKAFKTNALQLVQNVKKTGSIPNETYRIVLRNLLFFYCDKLIHLLPEALTSNTSSTIQDVLTRIKTEQTFDNESLTDLRGAWQAADITTVQNTLVVAELNKLFES